MGELESLLAEQLEMVQSGNIASALELTERTGRIVGRLELAAGNVVEQSGEHAERIGKLYRKVCLTLAGHREDLAAKLDQVRSGRGALRAYRGSGER